MLRSLLALSLPGLLILTGCGRKPLPVNSNPPADEAELATRYDKLDVGITEAKIAAFMGKPGADVAGYSTQVVKRKPESAGEFTPGDSYKHWASSDWRGAIRVHFGSDGKARQIQLLRLTPMGPIPPATDEPQKP